MKILTKILLFIIFLLSACGKSGNHEHHDQDESKANDPNQALYEEVMAVHDEVMPKSDEIYKLKKDLQNKVEDPKLAADRRKQLDQVIAQLDSADRSMMDWMHKFKPLPDSANQEIAREYLENEMEKIKKVRNLINESLQKAKEEIGKK